VLEKLAQQLGFLLQKRKMLCAVAESCTGGSLAAVITSIPESSTWFDRGFITYSNEAKEEMLAVPHYTLATYGAVSKETARAMAEGALSASHASITVAITGIAGPSGGSLEKPVGTVWIAWAGASQLTRAELFTFTGDRTAIRRKSVEMALRGLIHRCQI